MTHVRNPPINYLANVTQKNLTHLASSNVPYIGPRDCFASQGMPKFLFQPVSDKQSRITSLASLFCAPIYEKKDLFYVTSINCLSLDLITFCCGLLTPFSSPHIWKKTYDHPFPFSKCVQYAYSRRTSSLQMRY